MLELGPAHPKTKTYQRQFFDDALPAGLKTADFAAFDASAHDEISLRRGRRAWELRTLDEYRSQVAFTQLLADLTVLGAPFDILSTAIRVVRDEGCHTELCRRMVRALGGSDTIKGEPTFVRPNPKLSARLRVLHLVAGSLCIGETISVRLLSAVRDTTACPLAKRVMTQLVKDESIHSRFGWTVLEWLLPSLDKKERRVLAKWLPQFLRAAEKGAAPSRAPTSPDDNPLVTGPRSPFGSLAPQRRAEVFGAALTDDVVTRFRALGFDINTPIVSAVA